MDDEVFFGGAHASQLARPSPDSYSPDGENLYKSFRSKADEMWYLSMESSIGTGVSSSGS